MNHVCIMSGGWPVIFNLFTWRRNGCWMHYGKKTGLRRQCYALGNVVLGNLRSCIHVDVTLTPTSYLKKFTDHKEVVKLL